MMTGSADRIFPGRSILFGALAGLAMTLILGCSRHVERREPVNKNFPAVSATLLTGESLEIPGDFQGTPILLLVGYVQDAQFDIDRWLLGLAQAETPVKVLEVPTIRGWIPRMISGAIDSGMRRGIPEEDWRLVATVYRDAPVIIDFLGNEEPLSARVVLLDEEGRVVWVHDQGYSASKLIELDRLVRSEEERMQKMKPRSSAIEEALTDNLDRFKEVMNSMSFETLDEINDVYGPDVTFVDPLHEIAGREALRDYFSRMYQNVAFCEFEFQEEVLSEDSAALVWTMRMRHENFRPDETLILPGMSYLRFEDGRVVYHRDSFDLGAMIYERVPVLGSVVRHIKGRI